MVPSPRSTPLLLVLCLVNRGGGEGEALGTVFLALQCAVHLAATDVVARKRGRASVVIVGMPVMVISTGSRLLSAIDARAKTRALGICACRLSAR